MELSQTRILHLTNSLGYGGVEKIIFQLCEGMNSSVDTIIVVSSGGVYVKKLETIGIEHYEIPDISTKSPKQFFQIIRTLKKLIEKYQINVIHCHHRSAVIFAKMFRRKVTIIYNNHTVYSNRALMSHFVLKNVNIIADGFQAKKNVTDYFRIKKQHIEIINNAVDEYNEELVEVPEIAERKRRGEFIVVNSARLHPYKGIEYFVDAAKILIDKKYNICFFIVGDGELRESVETRIKELGLLGNVIMLGFREDIKNVIVQSDVLVLSSVYEGLPLTPMEAFSVRRAAIGTDIAGTREVIHDGVNGLLAESKNPQSIAEKIAMVYENRELLDELNEGAYRSFLQEFSKEKFIQKYIEYYKKM